jgi:O-glycosyl hydrolase
MSGILFAFSMILIACPEENPMYKAPPAPPGPTSALPQFSLHPTSANYGLSDTARELKIAFTVSDGGTTDVQWYKASTFTNTSGTAIEDETTNTYTPDISVIGTTYYYAVVTNTLITYEEGYTPAGDDSDKDHIVKTLTNKAASNPAQIAVTTEPPPPPANNITVSSTQVQYIRGFGGMSNAFAYGNNARYMELRDIDTMFNPEGPLGLNILRIYIWHEPLAEILRGMHYPQMGNQIYVDIAKRVNKYGGYLLASPWSPPAQYKTNDSVNGGGHLRTNYYRQYATYLREWAQDMADRGAPLYAISLQNEPSFEARYEGMEWTQNEHRDWLRDHGAYVTKLNASGASAPVPGYGGGEAQPRVLLMGGEAHTTITWNEAALSNTDSRAQMDIVAYHTYGNMNSRYALARQQPDPKEIWMTEKNMNSGSEALYPQDSTWNYVWVVAYEIHHALTNVDTSAYVWWYAKRFYSFVGDGSATTINGNPLPRGYVMAHWAKYATDTVRLNTSSNLDLGTSNTGTLGSEFIGSNFGVSAFIRKSDPNMANFDEAKLKSREDSISLVIFDRRTNAAGQSNTIRVNLPSGFVAANAYGVISDATRKHAPVVVVLGPDGTFGDVTLPSNSIISLKFLK